MCNGLDDNLLNIIQKLKINKPTVVGCGMGNLDHCIDVLNKDYVSGLTISSSLYSQDIVINKLKSELKKRKIPINEI